MLRHRILLTSYYHTTNEAEPHKGILYRKASTESFEDFIQTCNAVENDVTLDAILKVGWKYVCILGTKIYFIIMSDEPIYIVNYKQKVFLVLHGHRSVIRKRADYNDTTLSLQNIPSITMMQTWTLEDFDVEDYKIETWISGEEIVWSNFDLHLWADTLEQGKTSLVVFDKNLDNPNMNNKGFTRYYFKNNLNNTYTYNNYPFYVIKNDDGTYQLCIATINNARYHCGSNWNLQQDNSIILSGRDGNYKLESVKRTQTEMDAIIANAPICLWEYNIEKV